MDIRQKLNILQIIVDIERQYLGVKQTICIGASSLDKESLTNGTKGCYNNPCKTITIDLQTIEYSKGTVCLSIVLHECYHALEYEMVELYNSLDDNQRRLKPFEDIKQFKNEFENYINGTDKYSFQSYYDQLCEIRARQYAENRYIAYFTAIQDYNNKNNYSDTTIWKVWKSPRNRLQSVSESLRLFSSNSVSVCCGMLHNSDYDLCGTENRCANRLRLFECCNQQTIFSI